MCFVCFVNHLFVKRQVVYPCLYMSRHCSRNKTHSGWHSAEVLLKSKPTHPSLPVCVCVCSCVVPCGLMIPDLWIPVCVCVCGRVFIAVQQMAEAHMQKLGVYPHVEEEGEEPIQRGGEEISSSCTPGNLMSHHRWTLHICMLRCQYYILFYHLIWKGYCWMFISALQKQ